MEQYFPETLARNDSIKEDGAFVKCETFSTPVDECENNSSVGFDCNICLDVVQDPVVTLCGHLYCWPCIYKWIHFQSLSAENMDPHQPQCPVCKADVSQRTLVPLYGRGQTTKPSEGKYPDPGMVVPQRPPTPTCRVHTPFTTATTTSSTPSQQLLHGSYPQRSQPYHPHLGLGGMPSTDLSPPMVGMFGEMVYARLFGNSEASLYTYPNSYHHAGSNSPRVRRHIMRTDESLSRVFFFPLLLCSFVPSIVLITLLFLPAPCTVHPVKIMNIVSTLDRHIIFAQV